MEIDKRKTTSSMSNLDNTPTIGTMEPENNSGSSTSEIESLPPPPLPPQPLDEGLEDDEEELDEEKIRQREAELIRQAEEAEEELERLRLEMAEMERLEREPQQQAETAGEAGAAGVDATEDKVEAGASLVEAERHEAEVKSDEAEEAEKKLQAEEAARQAEEAEKQRQAEEAEKKRQAEEAEKKKQAANQQKKDDSDDDSDDSDDSDDDYDEDDDDDNTPAAGRNRNITVASATNLLSKYFAAPPVSDTNAAPAEASTTKAESGVIPALEVSLAPTSDGPKSARDAVSPRDVGVTPRSKALSEKAEPQVVFKVEESPTPVVVKTAKEGWLWKVGGKKSGKDGNIQRRWFVLSKGTISYFKSPTSPKVKGTIDVASISGMELDPISKQHSWSLVTPTRIYYIHGRTDEERDDWIDIIRLAQKEKSGVFRNAQSVGPGASALGMSPITKDGYLSKIGGKKKNGENGQWQKRWFSLKHDVLTYAGSPDAKKLKGTIDLSTVENVEAISSKRPNTFIIVTPARVFYTSATTAEEQNAWVQAIKNNSKLCKRADGAS